MSRVTVTWLSWQPGHWHTATGLCTLNTLTLTTLGTGTRRLLHQGTSVPQFWHQCIQVYIVAHNTQYSTYFCLTLLTGACLQNLHWHWQAGFKLAIKENLCSQELERPCLNASKMPSLNIVNINHQCQNCITPHGPDQLRHDTSQENCPLPGARNQAHGIYMLRFSHSSCTQPLWK